MRGWQMTPNNTTAPGEIAAIVSKDNGSISLATLDMVNKACGEPCKLPDSMLSPALILSSPPYEGSEGTFSVGRAKSKGGWDGGGGAEKGSKELAERRIEQ